MTTVFFVILTITSGIFGQTIEVPAQDQKACIEFVKNYSNSKLTTKNGDEFTITARCVKREVKIS